LKVASLVAGMVAGADGVDDMALLRHGGMGRVSARCRTVAPSHWLASRAKDPRLRWANSRWQCTADRATQSAVAGFPAGRHRLQNLPALISAPRRDPGPGASRRYGPGFGFGLPGRDAIGGWLAVTHC
jgi:hypothetical protein